MVNSDYLLYGNSVKNVLSVEPRRNGVRVYDNTKNKKLYEFTPFLWLENTDYLIRFKYKSVEKLNGKGCKYLVFFDNPRDFYTASRTLYMLGANYQKISDMQQQFMVQTGITQFKGMTLEDLRIMQFDIETLGGVRTTDNEIACIGIKCGKFETVITGTQEEIINKFVYWVRRINPHVIETYNGEMFDWQVIRDVANRCDIPLALGVNGEILYSYKTNIKLSESQNVVIDKTYIVGRHVVDLYHLIKRYNVVKRMFDSYNLKEVIKTLGLARDERVYIAGENLAEVWRSGIPGKNKIMEYCLDDCRELEMVSNLLLPSEFYQAQMLPISFEKVCITGTANKINSLFYRYYYKMKQAIPIAEKPDTDEKYQGAIVGAYASGVFRDVFKVDISSLYPSIMMNFKIKPRQDELNVFLSALTHLTKRRLGIKEKAKTLKGKDKEIADAIQNAFKIIVNSSYGLLGSQVSPWSDRKSAEAVTAKGREILMAMVDSLKEAGIKILEIDTDGIYVCKEQ